MLMFVLRRIVAGVVLVFAISFIAFMLLYMRGDSIARSMLGTTATAEDVAKKAQQLGLNQPLLTHFGEWLTSALSGNLGRSWTTGQLVSVSVTTRFGVTLSLVVGAMILATILSVLLGVLAARRGGWIDGLLQIVSIIGFAIPGFLMALFLVVVFAINLHWFQAVGYTPITVSPGGWLATVTLPIVALAIGAIAAVSQQIRGAVRDAMALDFVRTLRSRGLGINRVLFRHVLRNAGGPALSVMSLVFVGLIGGAVVIEEVFALPGIGQLTIQASTSADIPVVMGVVVVTAILVVVVNLIVDLAQSALNPKVRLS